MAKKEVIKATEKVETKKRCFNSNTMRPAIVSAHNKNNNRAITKQDCKEFGIGEDYWYQWVSDVKDVYEAVRAHMTVKLSKDFAVHTEEALKSTFNAIFPLWKEVLGAGESSPWSSELLVEECDVVSLVGYMEQFVATYKGTQRACNTLDVFRKKVESLIGWKIAKNEALSDNDVLIISTHESALRTIENCDNAIAELNKQIAYVNKMIAGAKSEEFIEYLKRRVEILKNGDDKGDEKVLGIKDHEQRKKEAVAKRDATHDQYVEIMDKLEELV